MMFGCFFLSSCTKEDVSEVERIEITYLFYEDYSEKDHISLIRDSLYFIDIPRRLKQITSSIPSVYRRLRDTDFNSNTILITAAREDYNVFTYEVKLFFNTLSKTCDFIVTYVLDEPPFVDKTYFRVWVCVVPKMSSEPQKSFVHCDITK